MNRLGRTIVAAALLAIAGCATVDPAPEWDRVQAETERRVEGDLHWERSERDARFIQERVDALLADGISRNEAVRIALLDNRRLQAEFERIGIAKAELIQAGLLTNPRLMGEFRFPLDGGMTTVESGFFAFLSDLWIVPIREEFAERHNRAVLKEVEASVVEVAIHAMMAYDDLLFRMADYQNHQETLAIHRDTAERVKVRYASGQANDFQVYQAEAIVEQQEIDLARAERDRSQARVRFAMLLNLPMEKRKELALTDKLEEVPENMWMVEEAVEYATEHRLDVPLAELAVEQAERHVELERARIFENVQAGVSHEGKIDGEHEVGPALSLELPLFDQNQAQIAKAEYRLRQATKNRQVVENNIRREVARAISDIKFRRRHIEIYQSRLADLRQRSVEYTEEYGNLMRLNWLNFLEARDQLIHDRRAYLVALWQHRISDAQLRRAMLGGRARGILDVRGAPDILEGIEGEVPE